jgi:hypothetical protein
MFVELVCNCDCSFSVDSGEIDNGEALWSLIWRFTNAHMRCGFVSYSDAPEGERDTYKDEALKPKRRAFKEEIDDEEDDS